MSSAQNHTREHVAEAGLARGPTLLGSKLSEIERLLSPRVWLALWWWYVFILIPTIGLKWIFINHTSDETATFAPSWVLFALGEKQNPMLRAWHLALVLRSDLIEVLVLVACCFIVGRVLLRCRLNYLIVSTVLLILLLDGANYVTVKELGTLVSVHVLAISWDWVKDHPDIATHFVTPRKTAFIVLLLLWPLGPVILSRHQPGLRSEARRFSRWPQLMLLLVLLAALVLPGPVLPTFSMGAEGPGQRSPLQGYWSSTIASLLNFERHNPLGLKAPLPSELQARYWKIAYPAGRADTPAFLIKLPPAKLQPHHIVIVCLETAARRYYPITENRELPAFYMMTQHAIISDHHYTTKPLTTGAIYSILTGTYQRAGRDVEDYGHIETDGLATTLVQHRYETAYIDSYKVDWEGNERKNERLIRDLGFQTIINVWRRWQRWPPRFEERAARERESFQYALEKVRGAERHGTKALIFIATTIGHFPWVSREEIKDRPAAVKLYGLAKLFDENLRGFLRSLDEDGLGNDIIIVVTGDHGLRFRAEFTSLGEPLRHGDLSFNVPLMIYAPALLDAPLRLPYTTSHVDLAPTLLALVGVDARGLLFHGENMLDERLRDRVTFMMNTELSPVDGFQWRGFDSRLNHVTGQVEVVRREGNSEDSLHSLLGGRGDAPTQLDIAGQLARASDLFDLTAAYFLKRRHLDSGSRGASEARSSP